MRQIKKDILQELTDRLTGDATIYGVWYVEFRGRGGWWAVPDSCRWFGDNGFWLGDDYSEARKAILKMWDNEY